jgi:hypothetical protein
MRTPMLPIGGSGEGCSKKGGNGGTFTLNTTGTNINTIAVDVGFKPSRIIIIHTSSGYMLQDEYDQSVSKSTQTLITYTNARYVSTPNISTDTNLGIRSISDTQFVFAINNASYNGSYSWIAVE